MGSHDLSGPSTKLLGLCNYFHVQIVKIMKPQANQGGLIVSSTGKQIPAFSKLFTIGSENQNLI